MSKLSSAKIARIYERAFHGDLELIGWGHRNFFHFQRWQEKFPLKILTDASYDLWDRVIDGYSIINPLALKDYRASDHALINYYDIPWVAEYVKRVGNMPLLPPLPLQHIMRIIATKGYEPSRTPSPMSARDQQYLMEEISDELENYDTRHSKKTFATGKKYQSILKLLSSYHWTDCVASICASLAEQPSNKNCIVLAGNSLCTGGAERQMLNLAVGFRQQRWETHSLSLVNSENAPHYVDVLRKHDVPMHLVENGKTESTSAFMRDFLAAQPPNIRLALWHLPIALTLRVACAVRFFQRVRPSLVISYLDWSNTVVGLGAVLAGVPNIILSGRNYPPTHFPHFFSATHENFRQVYQILAQSPRVHLTNNSPPAAAAYAKWLKLPQSKVIFIPNCLTQEFMTAPPVKKVKELRSRLIIKPHEQVVLGVFRLSKEKRPEQFLAIIAALAKKVPNLRAFVCGGGVMQDELATLVEKYRLNKIVTFVGMIAEIREMMHLANVLLHTAEYEGMPNVILEAQSQGLPVICTRSGGVTDCLASELLPYSFSKNDWKGVTTAMLELLNNAPLRKKLGCAAQRYIRREFSISQLVNRNLATIQLKKTNGTLSSGKKVHA